MTTPGVTSQPDVAEVSSESQTNAREIPKLIWIMIGLAIALGVFFRFSNIDKKVFWKDEVITEFAIAGRNPAVETGRLLNKNEVLEAVRLDNTSSEKEVISTLAMNRAEQGPVYYALARAWCDVFGADPYQLRMFSVLVGILLIAATYVLGCELFGTALAGGISAALVAVSPFHLAYSQEARPYVLWELFMVLASITLWRAVQKPTIQRWSLYAATLSLSFYTQLLTAAFFIAQCIFMAIWQKRLHKHFLIAIGAVLLTFAPWLVLVPDHATKSNWLSAPNMSLMEYFKGVYVVFACAFYDGNTTPYTAPNMVTTIICLAGVVAFAFILDYMLDQSKRTAASKYLLTLLIVPALCIVANDLHTHNCMAFYSRYLTPTYLAISLCLAGGISYGLRSEKSMVRNFMAAALGLFFTIGLMSCVQFHQAKVWHQHAESLERLASKINVYPAPIVVVDKMLPDVAITFCRLLRDDAKLMVNPTPDSVAPTTDFFQVHMLNGPSNPWKCKFIQKNQTDPTTGNSPTTIP